MSSRDLSQGRGEARWCVVGRARYEPTQPIGIVRTPLLDLGRTMVKPTARDRAERGKYGVVEEAILPNALVYEQPLGLSLKPQLKLAVARRLSFSRGPA